MRLFQRLMEQRAAELRAGGEALEGVHMSSIQTYLNGSVTPSLAFLKEAADVLGLRASWLVLGEGNPTWAEAAEDEAAIWLLGEASPETRGPHDHVKLPLEAGTPVMRAFNEGAGVVLPLEGLALSGNRFLPSSTFWTLFRLYRLRCKGLSVSKIRRNAEKLAREIGAAVVAPLTALGLNPGTLDDDFFEEYVLLVSLVLQRVIEEDRENAQEA